ncbi:MAG: hypothetical protein IKB01_07490 [Lachnospiraceae bacterium]|nr:hypothetical protein [Lachnospiraceae bacterium]
MKKQEIFEKVRTMADSTILSFEDRGPWGLSSYRGNFSGWIPASLIYRYDAKSVSEIFAGGGTTSDLCKDLEIPYCGIDLNPNPVRSDIIAMDILDETMDLPDAFYRADMQILHPPYPCIQHLHYSNAMWKDTKGVASSDIQEMSWEQGMNAINKALLRGYTAMPAGSHQAVVVGDIRRKVDGKSVFKSMLTDLAIPGEMVQILVKRQHNTVSGRNSSYSGNNRRNFFLIEHEFIVVIKKPSGYEVAYILPKKYTADVRDSVSTATWKDVVYAVLRKLGKVCNLEMIYAEIEGHKKAQANPHWKDKVRQVLQELKMKGVAVNTSYGLWGLAA